MGGGTNEAEEICSELGGGWTMKAMFKMLLFTLNSIDILKGIWGSRGSVQGMTFTFCILKKITLDEDEGWSR